MKSVLKLMKRFFFTLLCSGFILLVLNLGLLIYMLGYKLLVEE